MKVKRVVLYIALIVLIFTVSFSIGLLMMEKYKDKNNAINNSLNLDNKTKDIEISNQEDVVTPNTILEERKYYSKCGHLLVDTSFPSNDIINKNEEEYSKYLASEHPNIRLISFSSSKLVLWEEKDQLCENHHIIGEMNGYIAVFNINESGEQVLNTLFEDYPISLLMDIDKERINKGIVVDSEDELSEILENFIS